MRPSRSSNGVASGLDGRDGEEADIALAASEARPALAVARMRAETGYAPRMLENGLASLAPAPRPALEVTS
jgi:hypothetical protein